LNNCNAYGVNGVNYHTRFLVHNDVPGMDRKSIIDLSSDGPACLHYWSKDFTLRASQAFSADYIYFFGDQYSTGADDFYDHIKFDIRNSSIAGVTGGGDLYIGQRYANDDDYLFFDNAGEQFLAWDEANNMSVPASTAAGRFVLSDNLVTPGGTFDIAEEIAGNPEEELEPGDVLIVDSSASDWHVTKSTRPYDSRLAGVFTTAPGVYMSFDGMSVGGGGMDFSQYSGTDHGGSVPLALAGRVPVKVCSQNGPIRKGDLLTTSSMPGHAMKFELLDPQSAQDLSGLKAIIAENDRRRNSVLGKALEDFISGVGDLAATGRIEALIGK